MTGNARGGTGQEELLKRVAELLEAAERSLTAEARREPPDLGEAETLLATLCATVTDTCEGHL
ncbi:hypothetical protein P1P68_13755 [Streptomyces scabiei]|uniref:hypothetical protein n=1 Tax=Streptomyces scabiei TaxID=1930 RepID=UPI00298FB35B|nr:hypothetical protein [Streptomyces scabiei]MDW8805818.1 hypothetical protein [Streptomyces scabiei]